MHLERWDEEFAELESDISRIEKPLHGHSLEDHITIIQKQAAILQIESELESAIEQISSARSKPNIASHKPKSIIHWANIMVQTLKRTYQKKASFIGRSLWINLIRSKMNLASTHELPFTDDIHLMEMATREIELKNQEKALNLKLVQIDETKKTLRRDYEQIQARIANEEAASCLQKNWLPKKEKKDPSYSSLKQFINNLSTMTRASTETEIELQSLHNDLVQQTNNLVAECKVILSKEIGPNRMTIGAQRIKKLESSLASLDLLQEKVASGQKRLKQTTPPPLHPIMMKHSPKSASNKAEADRRSTLS